MQGVYIWYALMYICNADLSVLEHPDFSVLGASGNNTFCLYRYEHIVC